MNQNWEYRDINGLLNYRNARQNHWDSVAVSLSDWKGIGGYYHKRLADLVGYVIPPNKKVLELGCGDGNLLHSTKPSIGIGLDFSEKMCQLSKQNHPELVIIQADAHYLPVDEKFDFIILSDLLNDLWDAQQVLTQVRRLCHERTRIILNSYSKLWEIPLKIGQKLKLAKPNLPQNWFSNHDISQILNLEDFEVVKHSREIVFPLYIPLVTPLINRFLGKTWPFKHLAVTNLMVAKPDDRAKSEADRTVSIIIPARNEAGNIETLVQRVPEIGGGTEIVFIEGHSLDNTYDTIHEVIKKYPNRDIKVAQQTGKGKGDAVRLGFQMASGDVLMILDADISVPPEDIALFYNALVEHKGEFINGVRLVYPMEDQAMRFLNLLGNRFFSRTFSWLMGQPVKDTLCGTKVLLKEDYLRIAENRSYFGDFDPFGDFDLLFGATKLSLKIIDIPIRYRSRIYGSTNIHRFRHGFLLLRMVFVAAIKLKFI